MPTTFASLALADGSGDRRERGEGVARDERRGGAALASVIPELPADPDADEEVARLDAARVDLHARDLAGSVELARREPPHLVDA